MSYICSFLSSPSLEQFEAFRNDDLLQIVEYYTIPISKHIVKKEMKQIVLTKLVELQFLCLSPQVDTTVAELGLRVVQVQTPNVVEEGEITPHVKATLPRFDPLSSSSPGPRDEAPLKVHLAQFQRESEEKGRCAERELRLAIHKMELETEKEIRFWEMEFQAVKTVPASFIRSNLVTSFWKPPLIVLPSCPSKHQVESLPESRVPLMPAIYASGQIVFVPPFKEAEVDTLSL